MEERSVYSTLPSANPKSRDIRDCIKWIKAGDLEAEKKLKSEFLDILSIFIYQDDLSSYVPYPNILAEIALNSFLAHIKEHNIKEASSAEEIVNEIRKYFQNKENIDKAIDLSLKKLVQNYRYQIVLASKKWREKIKSKLEKEYLPYIFGLIKLADPRIRNEVALAYESLGALTKVVIEDIENEGKDRHYGRLIRKIVKCDISTEIKIVARKEKLVELEENNNGYFKEHPCDPMHEFEADMDFIKICNEFPAIFEEHLNPNEKCICRNKFQKNKKRNQIVEDMSEFQEDNLLNTKHKINTLFITRTYRKALKKMHKALNQKGIYSFSFSQLGVLLKLWGE